MALKFLNKKGWHTGSLRNIENVWKAEQKHDAEQRKLDELRKQIQEERERAEFRLLQERAGLAPRQERLEFLYESGLAVGKGSSEGFKALQAPQKAETSAVASAEPSTSKAAAAPGALFEVEKPQSANDTWRKLHSDPLLLIRQREQEALARIKNNPVQMAMIRKSVEAEKKEREKGDDRKEKKKEKREKKEKKREGRKRRRRRYSSESSQSGDDGEKTRSSDRRSTRLKERRSPSPRPLPPPPPPPPRQSSEWQRGHHRKAASKLSEEERAARLREMQLDAELHEEQRWKRINKASERDAREAAQGGTGGGKNFLDAARKSMFGTDEGGSATVEESVRRRTYYLQGGGGGAGADEVNAFRRH